MSQNKNDHVLTPEEIIATLAAMDKIIAFEMTPEEEAALASERRDRKEWEEAHFVEYAEKLRMMWD